MNGGLKPALRRRRYSYETLPPMEAWDGLIKDYVEWAGRE